MWIRDEFLARDRVAERDRELLASARVRGLLVPRESAPVDLGPDLRVTRRTIARALARAGRAAVAAACRLDPGAVSDVPVARRASSARPMQGRG